MLETTRRQWRTRGIMNHHLLQAPGSGGHGGLRLASDSGLIPMPPPDFEFARHDALLACNPDIDRPFASFDDACHRLLAFHVLADDDSDDVKDILVDSTGRLLSSARYWNEALASKIREQECAFREQLDAFNSLVKKKAEGHMRAEEGVLIERFLLQEERQRIVREKEEVEIRMREEANMKGVIETQWTVAANRMAQTQMDRNVRMAQTQMDRNVQMAQSQIAAEGSSFMYGEPSIPILASIQRPSFNLLTTQPKQSYCLNNILVPAHSFGQSSSSQHHHRSTFNQEPESAPPAFPPPDQECIDISYGWGEESTNGSINLLAPHDNGMLDINNTMAFR